ncbi:MAG TPA: TetR/AcrR family transcriptional regulator [Mycobacteriales bacterium]|nr:TetR/AcrR family transcriptional regulator [Mycobacteriales bacterium]
MRCDAQRNRERLIEVASDAFAEHGVDASLEKIARAAGVGIGTLYRHFATRDALLEAVYRHNVEQLCASADELLATLPPDEALGQWMQSFVGYVAVKRGLASYLKSVVAADSDLFTYAHGLVRATVSRLIAAAVDAGAIREGVDGMDVLHALSGVCLMSDQSGDPEQGAKVAALLMDGLRYGAAAPAGATR